MPTGDISRSIRNRHGRGGFSQNRFQRLRDNEIKALVIKICELCEEYCFSEDHVFNVKGIVLAGNAEKKTLVSKHLVEILGISPPLVSIITTDGTLERSQCEARKEICRKLYPKEQRLAEKEITQLIERYPDRLVFGKKEVSQGLRDNNLKKVYMVKNSYGEKMQIVLDSNDTAEKICFNISPILEDFGGLVGLKWY